MGSFMCAPTQMMKIHISASLKSRFSKTSATTLIFFIG